MQVTDHGGRVPQMTYSCYIFGIKANHLVRGHRLRSDRRGMGSGRSKGPVTVIHLLEQAAVFKLLRE